MKKSKILIASLILTVLVGFSLVKNVNAKVTCWAEYGGEEVCERTGDIYLDKMVSLPREKNEGDLIFKDNLSEDAVERYVNGQIAVFEIKVKNVGDATLNKVTVKDRFPEYVDYPHDGDSRWDEGSRTYTYEISDLAIGETDTHQIEARVTTSNYVCVTNVAEAYPSEGSGDSDTAKLCAGERVLGVTTMPATGSHLLPILGTLILTGASAFLAKRKDQ